MIAAATIEPAGPSAIEALDELIDAELRQLDDQVPRAVWERVLIAPARDILARPSKQFRAQLVSAGMSLATGRLVRPPPSVIAAVEILHAGSLVVDDIEDEAEVRRGDVALHRRYGLPVALNAGNWMYFWAFALIDRAPVPEAMRAALHRAMLRGVLDCHAGQALDVGLDVTEVPRDQLRAVVSRACALKSGALTRLAIELGAILGEAAPERLDAIRTLGATLGLGLQMLDDFGGVTVEHRLAKGREDLGLLRPTWPWLWASERADDATWARTLRWARQIRVRREDPTPLARALGHLVAAPGRAEISRQLALALEQVRALGLEDMVGMIAAELGRLEAAYV